MVRLLIVTVVLCACGGGGGSDVADGGTVHDAATASDASRSVPDAQIDAGATVWRPPPGTSWQWQLSGDIDTSLDVQMYDIDLFDAPQATINSLHAAGRIVICYFSAGSYEQWRSDEADIPMQARGNALDGWPGEKWLDVRAPGVRAVMKARLDLAVSKNCDGVEPDNIDGYDNSSGFPLTAADQIDYNRFLAREAHTRGLSIGLKNDLAQVAELVDDFDWALNEQCFEYDECAKLIPFITAGKAVFNVEYGDASLANTVCPPATGLGFDTLIKRLELDAWRVACP